MDDFDDERAVREPCAVIQALLERGWSAADVCRAYAGLADRVGRAVPLLGARGPLPPAGTLVRVRCMVQDVFGPELFVRRVGKWHTVLGASVAHECAAAAADEGKDVPRDGDHEDDDALLRDKLADRTVLACVHIPGESPWVVHTADGSTLSDDDEEEENEDKEDDEEEEEDGKEDCQTSPKRHKAQQGDEDTETVEEEEKETAAAAETTEGRGGKAVAAPDYLVKVYDDGAWAAEDLRVNGAFEVVGVLECDVALRPPRAARDEAFPESEAARHPPALLCPRVHLLACRTLDRGTGHAALLPRFAAPPPAAAAAAAATEAAQLPGRAVDACVRGSVLAYLARPLGGDMLAAEYVLLALLARVTARHDGVNVGQLGVALTGVAPAAAARVVRALRALCARVVCVPLTVAALNTGGPLAPYKDYACERLVQTPLQLAAGTVVVVDETRLAPGTLTPAGTRNLQHLRELAQAQRVRYDFAYHDAEFPADAPVLALCRAGTSSLVLGSSSSSSSSSAVVPLCARTPSAPAAPPAPFRTRGTFLAQARHYVCAARELPQDVDAAAVALVQDDFVAARRAAAQQTGARAVAQDTLHYWMNLARAVARSFGEPALAARAWHHMRRLEAERLDRVQPLSPPPAPSSPSL